tara:strand:+ start:265 stop:537 length:273 start_codon:yes stop_codon:yes gene_type:complete
MPLPVVTKETVSSLAKVVEENQNYHLEVLKSLAETNPVLYNYLDYTIGLLQNKYSRLIGDEVGSVVGAVLGLLQSQADADEMAEQFDLKD